MKHLIVALALSLVLLVMLTAGAAASYTDQFGHTYTDAQVAQLCAHLRPGSHEYTFYNCANLP